ncbi:hypothetical protein CAAN1_12S00606 [[Candida] anglica]|uniref:CENP-T/Histone H4 histone fold domain-containing protein n=1 Tax=[Candida] anglica TaxID=148631 RepID=A0ABP0E939_9ASCO
MVQTEPTTPLRSSDAVERVGTITFSEPPPSRPIGVGVIEDGVNDGVRPMVESSVSASASVQARLPKTNVAEFLQQFITTKDMESTPGQKRSRPTTPYRGAESHSFAATFGSPRRKGSMTPQRQRTKRRRRSSIIDGKVVYDATYIGPVTIDYLRYFCQKSIEERDRIDKKKKEIVQRVETERGSSRSSIQSRPSLAPVEVSTQRRSLMEFPGLTPDHHPQSQQSPDEFNYSLPLPKTDLGSPPQFKEVEDDEINPFLNDSLVDGGSSSGDRTHDSVVGIDMVAMPPRYTPSIPKFPIAERETTSTNRPLSYLERILAAQAKKNRPVGESKHDDSGHVVSTGVDRLGDSPRTPEHIDDVSGSELVIQNMTTQTSKMEIRDLTRDATSIEDDEGRLSPVDLTSIVGTLDDTSGKKEQDIQTIEEVSVDKEEIIPTEIEEVGSGDGEDMSLDIESVHDISPPPSPPRVEIQEEDPEEYYSVEETSPTDGLSFEMPLDVEEEIEQVEEIPVQDEPTNDLDDPVEVEDASQMDEPTVDEKDEQIDEPSINQIDELSIHHDEPSVNQIDEPSADQIDEPSADQIDEPSADQIDEPSVGMDDPSPDQIDENEEVGPPSEDLLNTENSLQDELSENEQLSDSPTGQRDERDEQTPEARDSETENLDFPEDFDSPENLDLPNTPDSPANDLDLDEASLIQDHFTLDNLNTSTLLEDLDIVSTKSNAEPTQDVNETTSEVPESPASQRQYGVPSMFAEPRPESSRESSLLPLGVINNLMKNVLNTTTRGSSKTLSPEVLDYLQHISDDFLNSVVDDLEDYSKHRTRGKGKQINVKDVLLFMNRTNFVAKTPGEREDRASEISAISRLAHNFLPLELLLGLENSLENSTDLRKKKKPVRGKKMKKVVIQTDEDPTVETEFERTATNSRADSLEESQDIPENTDDDTNLDTPDFEKVTQDEDTSNDSEITSTNPRFESPVRSLFVDEDSDF